MNQDKIIEELTKELNKNHRGGFPMRIIELLVGLFFCFAGIINLSAFILIDKAPSDITPPPKEVALIAIGFIILGSMFLTRFFYFIKWRNAINKLKDNEKNASDSATAAQKI